MEINDIATILLEVSEEKGFDNNNIEELLLWIHSEISEAFTSYQHNDIKKFIEESTDAVIMCMLLLKKLDIDIEKSIMDKTEKNRKRKFRHKKIPLKERFTL